MRGGNGGKILIRNSLRWKAGGGGGAGGEGHHYQRLEPRQSQNGVPTLKWYACGPTVYDAAHLGHGRYCMYGMMHPFGPFL